MPVYRLVSATVISVLLAYTPIQAAQEGCDDVMAWGLTKQRDVPSPLVDVTAIGSGESNSIALRSDGMVVVWGEEESAVLTGSNGPPPLIPASAQFTTKAVAFGGTWMLTLSHDGKLQGRNRANLNQRYQYNNLTDVVAIAAGTDVHFSLMLMADGTIFTHGRENWTPTNLTNVKAIAAGSNHAMALQGDGTVVVWGDNQHGQTDVPAGLDDVVSIACGYNHCLAVRQDGTVVT